MPWKLHIYLTLNARQRVTGTVTGFVMNDYQVQIRKQPAVTKYM